MDIVFRNVHLSFRAYAVANLRYSWQMQRLRLLLPGLLVAGIVTTQLGGLFANSTPAEPAPDTGFSLLPYGLAGVLFLVLLPFSMWRAMRKRYNQTQFLQAPVTYTFGEAGISVDAPTIQATSTWDTIDKLVPTGQVDVLLTRNLTAYFLDQRCLQPPATLADFRALLARHAIAVK